MRLWRALVAIARFEATGVEAVYRLTLRRFGAPPGSDVIPYGLQQRTMGVVFSCVGLAEIGVTGLLAYGTRFALPLAVVHVVLLSTLVFAFLPYRAFPHLVTPDGLVLRRLRPTGITIPWSSISSATWVASSSYSPAESTFDLPLQHGVDVLVRLAGPLVVSGAEPVTAVRFAADSRHAIDQINARLAPVGDLA